MEASIAVPILVFAAVLAPTYLLLGARRRRPEAIRRRLSDHAVQVATAGAERIERINVLKATPSSRVALLDRLPAARTAARELLRADVELGVARYLLIRLAAAVVVSGAVWLLAGNPAIAVGAGLAAAMLPRLALRRRATKRRDAFEGQLAEAIDLLIGALRAGHGFLQAIEATAREMPDPMRKELLRVIEQVNVGGNPVDALQELTTRIESHDLKLLAAAIAVQRQSGGNLAEVLENLAATVRERRRVRGEVKSLTAGPRLSGYILGVMPVALVAYFVLVSADYRDKMLGTTLGNAMLGFAGIWTLIGYFLARKVAQVEY